MKIAYSLINFCLLLLAISFNGYGQQKSPIQPLEGYRSVLEFRFTNKEGWQVKSDSCKNVLLELLLNRRNAYNIIVPLEIANAQDTTINFYYVKDLRPLKKKKTGVDNHQISSIANTKEVAKYKRADLEKMRTFDFDSVFSYMRQNVFVNSKYYDLDEFLGSTDTNFCCNAQSGESKFGFIYLFFEHGILLREDTYNEFLYYVPY